MTTLGLVLAGSLTIPAAATVSLTLPKGGLTSIIGPNGAGKSTLMSMIARLLPIGHGTGMVDGLDVALAAGDALAKRLSILRQDNHLAARLTVADRGHIERALAYLGLEELKHRFLDELSGGQRQRASVAMVLAQDTDYMLFDEPLNNLDIRHAVAMMKLLRDAAKDLGKTVVVVLHDINFASCYSDHIVVMRKGRPFRQGVPEEILTEIYETDFKVREM